MTLKAPQAPKAKLSFKEKHALSTLPAEIANLEAEIKALTDKLADNGLYARDRTAFDAASTRLSDAQRRLEEAETQWLELEEKRAAVENSGRWRFLMPTSWPPRLPSRAKWDTTFVLGWPGQARPWSKRNSLPAPQYSLLQKSGGRGIGHRLKFDHKVDIIPIR